MSTAKNEIILAPDGTFRFVYSDEMMDFARYVGPTETRRASRVEPDGAFWKVDLSPVGGPVLGGFTRRSDALEAELNCLRSSRLPFPRKKESP